MLFDRLLDGLDVAVSAFAICEVRRDASLVLEDDASASIHYVLEGRGFLRTMSGPEVALAPLMVLIAPPKSCLFINCGNERDL